MQTPAKYSNEFRLHDQVLSKTANQRIFVLKANEKPPEMFEAEFDKLCQSIDRRDYDSALYKVSVLVPSFRNMTS